MRNDVIRWVHHHPSDIVQMMRVAGEVHYGRMSVWTATKRKQGLLRYVGSLRNGVGRPRDMFCNGWQPKHDNLRHAHIETEYCLSYRNAEFKRGYHVGEFRPDIEMRFPGSDTTYFIEIDCATESRIQIQRRWHRYRRFDADQGTVLIVSAGNDRTMVSAKERLEDLKKWSEAMYGIACFTTLEDVVCNPDGKVYWDEQGQCFVGLETP